MPELTPDEEDDSLLSLLAPLVLLALIVAALAFVCCGPGSAPPPADEPRSPRPHSYRSTVAMLRDEAAEDAADALAEDDAGYDALDDDEINELRAAQRGGESFFDMMLRVGRRKQE